MGISYIFKHAKNDDGRELNREKNNKTGGEEGGGLEQKEYQQVTEPHKPTDKSRSRSLLPSGARYPQPSLSLIFSQS